MSKFDNFWRLGTAQALAVASVGGAVASSAAFGTQTYAIQVNFPGSVSSTGGRRIAIVDPGTTVSSTVGTLLSANSAQVYRCTPGQRVSAISNDAGTFSLSITELTDQWTPIGQRTWQPLKRRLHLMPLPRTRRRLRPGRPLSLRS